MTSSPSFLHPFACSKEVNMDYVGDNLSPIEVEFGSAVEVGLCRWVTVGTLFLVFWGTEGGLLFCFSPLSTIEVVILEGIICSALFYLKTKVMGTYQKPIAIGCGIHVKPTLKDRHVWIHC
ncbi:hypothetical protein SUGI_0908760 [Cryptomeria japonica]|nr:hypothetical protein SUGI_0908760 [Cryptomeria japonica]